MDNYDQESEHSVMAEVPATEVDASQPLKMEMSVLTLDTSSQASAAETEASMESNPVSGISLTAVAHSSHSSSLIGDLSMHFSQMSIWLSIPCSPPKGLQNSKYNMPYETLRHHYTRVRQRQLPPMKRPRLPIRGGT